MEELQRTNTELQYRTQMAIREKEEAIAELTSQLEQSEERVQKLLAAAEEKDSTLVRLESRARLFYEVVEHRPVLARMVQILEELSQKEPEESQPEEDSPLVNGTGDASSSTSTVESVSGTEAADGEAGLQPLGSSTPAHSADR